MSGSGSSSEAGDEGNHAAKLHRDRVDAISQRRQLPAAIRAGPTAILHATPASVEMSMYTDLQSTLPNPPIFGQSEGNPESSVATDDGKVEKGVPVGSNRKPTSYTFLSVEGWFEVVTTDAFAPGLVLDGFAEELVLTLRGGLECLLQLSARLPVHVSISLMNVEEFRIQNGHYQYAASHLPAECTAGPTTVTQFEDDAGEIIQNLMEEIKCAAEA